jgi:DNA-binding NarL/FixJ family response regulator
MEESVAGKESDDLKSGAMPRVFVADTSSAFLERLVALINDVAHVVGTATTAQDAIDAIRRHQPHLTVFDVAMANGIDLLRQIKARQLPTIVVVLTHSVEEPTRRYCVRLGAEHFLDKLHEFGKVREIVMAVGTDGARAAADPPPFQ